MHLTIAPNGILQFDGARLVYRNFEGRGSKYNREGDRNFAIVIDEQDIADTLIEQGWNVKIKPPREAGEDPFMYLSVKLKFNANGPHVYLVSNGVKRKLTEDSVECLDQIRISSANMDIRPYDWELNGDSGRSAYLYALEVYQEIDRFAVDRDDYEDAPF